jgi:DNA-binding FrmR family transcriptional regulator
VPKLKKRASRTAAARLHKLSGQLSGVERMLRDRRPCRDVLTQLSAVQSGIKQVGAIVIRDEVRRTAGSNRLRTQLEDLITKLSPL